MPSTESHGQGIASKRMGRAEQGTAGTKQRIVLRRLSSAPYSKGKVQICDVWRRQGDSRQCKGSAEQSNAQAKRSEVLFSNGEVQQGKAKAK